MTNETVYKKICPRCGCPADKNAIFCPNCGESLQDVFPTAPAPDPDATLILEPYTPSEPTTVLDPVPTPEDLAPKKKKSKVLPVMAIVLVLLAACAAIAVFVFPDQLRQMTGHFPGGSSAESSSQESSATPEPREEPKTSEPAMEESTVESSESTETVPEESSSDAESSDETEASEEGSSEESQEDKPSEPKKTPEELYADAYDLKDSYSLETPVIHHLEVNRKGYITFDWEAVEGAKIYRLFRYNSVDDKGWVELGDISDELKYTDKDVEAYGEYYYAVRVVTSKGKYKSGVKITHEVMPRPAPSNLTAKRVGDSIEITWDEIVRCKRYRVYRKVEDGWESIGETTINHFTDTSVEEGKPYTYTVRCLSASGKTIVSGYDKDGVTVE